MTRPGLTETERQQLLLSALWRQQPAAELAPHLREGPTLQRGLQAYQAHAGAQAQRALAAAYPTVQALISEESMGSVARALWLQKPPLQGDLALWGQALAAFIEALPDLADEPYLGDVARLEWAVHQAHTAADHDLPPAGLHRLAGPGAEALTVRLRPGTAMVVSLHPICSIWHAHQPRDVAAGADAGDADAFESLRLALASGTAETAWVFRDGFAVRVQTLLPQQASFAAAVVAGRSLGQALAAADERFDFETWLHAGLQDAWLVGLADARVPTDPVGLR